MSRSDAGKLAEWRSIGARRSEQTVELATKILASGNVGDQEWALREQLAIAALDMGRIKLASDQIETLHAKFPNSPRVRILDGLRLEADEDFVRAKAVYEDLLKEDETNVTAHQRLISLSLPSSSAIPLLLSYLDTFYSDPAAWSVLADLYCEKGLYSQALTALGHIAIISNWDDGVIRRSGEVAYTMGDYQLALKYFLRAAEMQGGKDNNSNTSRTRTWWGIKLTITRLLNSPNVNTSVPQDIRTTEKQLKDLDVLATERLLAAKGKGIDVRRQMLGEMVSNR
ncbi:uncharacterized protein L203_104930 [Cryptococcus depauperatus CBS 7841]|uniref:ER membrane protein complex subunit 2 n=1 Tax=Cryptococcus depauperatus CBS 7841 TaxID=1295531 RepID=A0A1E3IQF5_9TREE|nr:hypothetical protein L203_01858 [Cryptococcus depauperatus CBS 7841]